MACFESRGRRAWGLGAARGVGRTRFAAPRRAPRAGAGNVTRSAARQRPTRAHGAPLMRESAPRGALFAPKATAALPTRRPPPRPYRAARCLVPPRGEPRRLAAERPRRASSRENVSQRARRGRRARGSARGPHYFIQFIKNNVFLRPGSCGAAGSGGPPHAPGLWMPLVATPPLAPRGNIYHLKESPKSPPQVWACFRRVSVSYCQLRSRSGVSATPAVAPALQRQAGTTRRGRGGRGPQEAVCLAGELCV